MVVTIVGTIVVVTVFFLICASIAKALAFRSPTPDGDTVGNRLAGHGPNDEIHEPTVRERVARVRGWVRSRARR